MNASTCEADSGSATDCQPVCDQPATKVVTMRLHTGQTYDGRLCTWHAELRAWNNGCPSAHVSTVAITDRRS